MSINFWAMERPDTTPPSLSLNYHLYADDTIFFSFYAPDFLSNITYRTFLMLYNTARLSADARRYDHVTPLLMDLHWLRVPQRIQYKLSVLMYIVASTEQRHDT